MRRAFAAVVAVGVLGLILAAVLRDETHAFTLGITPGGPAAVLRADEGVCQGVIDVPRGGGFETVRLVVGTYFRTGSPLEITVRTPRGRTLATGKLEGGYPDVGEAPYHDVRVGQVDDEQPIAVCVRNTGDRRVALYGNSGLASRNTTLRTPDGEPLETDLSLEFHRDEPRSLASVLPDMLHRAALFSPAGSWALWVLLALTVAGVPVLLVRALVTTTDDDAGASDPDQATGR